MKGLLPVAPFEAGEKRKRKRREKSQARTSSEFLSFEEEFLEVFPEDHTARDGPECGGKGVPDLQGLGSQVRGLVSSCFGCGVFVAERVWDEAVFSAGESCGIVMDLCCSGGVVVVFWSVTARFWVHEWMHEHAGAVDVEVIDVEDLELAHEWLGVGARREVKEEADDAFLGSDEGLDIMGLVLCCTPDQDFSDQVGEDLGVV